MVSKSNLQVDMEPLDEEWVKALKAFDDIQAEMHAFQTELSEGYVMFCFRRNHRG